ncbi:MAG: aminoglycoside phosphotransferase family protein [Candidatus Paracaedibacteraceae bacterium]|nr:aminoglycoside phosphotransferase family protein [Candidatus Paracaedibacteraceae bacterium]
MSLNRENMKDIIDPVTAKILVEEQFPHWAHLPIVPVNESGWDNRTYHLGQEMILRFPSGESYANQVKKEQKWLPFLSSKLPLTIPTPLGLGKPGHGYMWDWSIYNWIPGETAAISKQADKNKLANDLARFLSVLYKMNPTNGPPAGKQNYYRGGDISVYEHEAINAIKVLESSLDSKVAKRIWDLGATTKWENPPVWVHGDISPGNLILQNGHLRAVIDFGLLSVGDPACDFAIAWTFFDAKSRKVFRDRLAIDNRTWHRGRAWAFWKALIISAGLSNSNNVENSLAQKVIREVMEDFKNN